MRVTFAISLFVVGPLLFQRAACANALLSSFTRFLSPGELTRSHAKEGKLKDCYACHTLTQGVNDSLCLGCHKAVKERLSDRGGYHGKLEGKCVECHTDHKGSNADIINLNSEAFNHRLANYALTGKHAEIDCEKCHSKKEPEDVVKTRYIDLNFGKCTDCHKDPHPKDFEVNCVKCHTTGGWSGRTSSYSHGLDSKYKLIGKHQEVSCDKCHKGPEPGSRFTLPNTTCLNCHSDVHNGQLSLQCERCHDESGWTGRNLKYSHALDSKYKLAGKHQALGCAKCHKRAASGAKPGAAQFTNLGTDCLQCHADEHEEQLSKKCRECHNEFAWKGAFVNFDHNEQSSYKLDATHESVACADCHRDKKYKPLKSECVDCHGEYDSIMAGRPGRTAAPIKADPHWKRVRCDQCHDTRAGKQKLAGYQDKCVECHNPRYGPLLLDWMKDWSRFRLDVRALLQQAAQEDALSAAGLESISRRLTETERVGAHNFPLAPLEWKALKADLEREISKNLAKRSNRSPTEETLKDSLNISRGTR